jgi:hypothetical protein
MTFKDEKRNLREENSKILINAIVDRKMVLYFFIKYMTFMQRKYLIIAKEKLFAT